MTFFVPTAPLPPKTKSPSTPVGRGEIFLTHRPHAGEGIREWLSRLEEKLKEMEATIAHVLVFGSSSASAAATEAMGRVFGGLDWPVTWAEGGSCDGSPIAGAQVVAFAGQVQRIRRASRVVGSVFEAGGMRHCFLGGLGPGQRESARADQARQTFDLLEGACDQAGFALADLVRTWFFLDDLHGWYGEFNAARTKRYSGIKFRSGALPASTGVGARNPAQSALAMAAWAVVPLDCAPARPSEETGAGPAGSWPNPPWAAASHSPSASIREIGSPLQCPAPNYGSSFSRAMEIVSLAGRRLTISGTASISPDGRTLHQDEPRGQVDLTMEVVDAILRSSSYSLGDVTRAVAYFKHPSQAPAFEHWLAAHGLASLPVISTQCAVCREDLLFELEADAYRCS